MPFYRNVDNLELFFSEEKLQDFPEIGPFYPAVLLQKTGNDFNIIEKYNVKIGWDKLKASTEKNLSLVLGSDVANYINLQKFNQTLRPPDPLSTVTTENLTQSRYSPKLQRQVKNEKLIRWKS